MNRGFEDLVREDTLLPATQGSVPAPAEAQRVDSLENRVRVTMDRLTELVEAQLPEAVDGLRSDFEELRSELRQALADANATLAEERFQLRSQIATTVGAANRWFVRTRDQLFERLDEVARTATEAQAEAEAAAAVAVAAAVPMPALEEGAPTEPAADEVAFEPESEPEPQLEPEPEPELVPEPQPELLADETAAMQWGGAGFEEAAEAAEYEDGDGAFEPGELAEGYDFELEAAPAPATLTVTLDSPELDVLLEPLREDLRELQGEISAMGSAVLALREDVEELGARIPTRARSPRFTPTQLNAIVEAVQAALPPPPVRRAATKKATAKRATAKATTKRVAAAAKRAATVRRAATVKRAATATRVATTRAAAAKRAGSKRAAAPATRRRTPAR